MDNLCVTCGKPVENALTCSCCGRPVHVREPDCGGWILDSWHPMAHDEDDGNEFWCQACLEEGLQETLVGDEEWFGFPRDEDQIDFG